MLAPDTVMLAQTASQMPSEQFRCIGPWTIEDPSEKDLQLVRTAVQRGVCRYVVFCHENKNADAALGEGGGETYCLKGFASAYQKLSMAKWEDAMGPKLQVVLPASGVCDVSACITHCKAPRKGVSEVEEFGVYDARKVQQVTPCKRKGGMMMDHTPPPPKWQDELWQNAKGVRVTVVDDTKASYVTDRYSYLVDMHVSGRACVIPPVLQQKGEIWNYIFSEPPRQVYMFSMETPLTLRSLIIEPVTELSKGILHIAKPAPGACTRFIKDAQVIILSNNVGDVRDGWKVWKVDKNNLVARDAHSQKGKKPTHADDENSD